MRENQELRDYEENRRDDREHDWQQEKIVTPPKPIAHADRSRAPRGNAALDAPRPLARS